ncbi:hypothetical protein N7478_002934 [Penicillium angulare]|uniref:uncharacterized protein n=1 Tax=Penicillium angulare TaxID=116970 RepID=UPI002540D8EC|nr:uncharacterized protein N7478_002934 [Penicillium angulare]KAJ5287248.1 hypothetical protein N7478_002934 [Penicillium angulare]
MSGNSAQTDPLRIGIVLFPGFEALDAFGPLNCINDLSWTENVSLALLSATLEPVTTRSPFCPGATGQSVVPTHTFTTPPPLDVLIVPGGQGTRVSSPLIEGTIAFIRDVYPQLKYLITVCNGSGLVARTGLLDGRRATTNKKAWEETTALGPKVYWVPRARWVTDGNIWSSSGVSAGIDVTLAWIEHLYGEGTAQGIADGLEHTRHKDSAVDPFADLYGL